MAAPGLVLHVGFQQTGATMLRRALTRLRPQLSRHGIGLVDHRALAKLAGVDGWRRSEAPDPGCVEAFERGVTELAEAEAHAVSRAAGQMHTIVVSSDHLLGRANLDARDERLFRPQAVPSVAQVIRALGGSHARLVLYVRRQDRLMEACYLRALGNGSTCRIEHKFPHRFEPVLDYHELIERLEGVPEVTDVRVRPFELVASSATDYVGDILGALGLSGRLDLTPVGNDLTPYRLYSDRSAAIALDVNPHLESPRERRLVRDFLIEQYPGTDDSSTRVLPAGDRREVLAAYATVNRRLFERWMPDLAGDSYDSDEATARLIASGGSSAPPPAAGAPGRRGRARHAWLRRPPGRRLFSRGRP